MAILVLAMDTLMVMATPMLTPSTMARGRLRPSLRLRLTILIAMELTAMLDLDTMAIVDGVSIGVAIAISVSIANTRIAIGKVRLGLSLRLGESHSDQGKLKLYHFINLFHFFKILLLTRATAFILMFL